MTITELLQDLDGWGQTSNPLEGIMVDEYAHDTGAYTHNVRPYYAETPPSLYIEDLKIPLSRKERNLLKRLIKKLKKRDYDDDRAAFEKKITPESDAVWTVVWSMESK